MPNHSETFEKIVALSLERQFIQDNYATLDNMHVRIRMHSINELLKQLWEKRREEMHKPRAVVRLERSKYRAGS